MHNSDTKIIEFVVNSSSNESLSNKIYVTIHLILHYLKSKQTRRNSSMVNT